MNDFRGFAKNDAQSLAIFAIVTSVILNLSDNNILTEQNLIKA